MSKKIIGLLLGAFLLVSLCVPAFAEDFSYPVTGSADELTVWMNLPGNVSTLVTNVGETPYMMALEEATGIKVKFIHPSSGSASESLNLLLASGDLPDLIEWNWRDFTGGPEKLISDGILMPLNELMQSSMPNLSVYYAANPEVDKAVKTDTGNYYVVPFLRETEVLRYSWGPVIRQDFLDAYDLEVPSTIDGWETVLRTFKENGVAKPFSAVGLFDSLRFGMFSGAYQAPLDYYYLDGKTTHGVLQPGFKDLLLRLHAWYAEGLIDADITTNDSAAVNAGLLSSAIGATVLSPGSGIGTLTTTARQAGDEVFKLVGAPYPTMNAGEVPMYVRREQIYPGGSGSIAMSTSCKNPELTARWLDYNWSPEGNLLANFGTEGVSFEMKDGVPTFTDLIIKNPDGLTVAAAMAMYCRSNYGGPFVQAEGYLFQYMVLEEQKQSILTWMQSDTTKYQLQPITPTVDEAETLSLLQTDINTYIQEMVIKFIIGAESIKDGYDAFVSTVQGMGIDKVLSIYDAATERYYAR